MEGLDDTGGLLADAVTHRRQMQDLPWAPGETDARSSALNKACVHQQGDLLSAADAIAHSFGSPHNGQEEALGMADTCLRLLLHGTTAGWLEDALRGGRKSCELGSWAARPSEELTAAVGTLPAKDSTRARLAKRAFERADASFG